MDFSITTNGPAGTTYDLFYGHGIHASVEWCFECQWYSWWWVSHCSPQGLLLAVVEEWEGVAADSREMPNWTIPQDHVVCTIHWFTIRWEVARSSSLGLADLVDNLAARESKIIQIAIQDDPSRFLSQMWNRIFLSNQKGCSSKYVFPTTDFMGKFTSRNPHQIYGGCFLTHLTGFPVSKIFPTKNPSIDISHEIPIPKIFPMVFHFPRYSHKIYSHHHYRLRFTKYTPIHHHYSFSKIRYHCVYIYIYLVIQSHPMQVPLCPASYVDCGRCSCVAESTCQFCSDEATTTAALATTTAPAPGDEHHGGHHGGSALVLEMGWPGDEKSLGNAGDGGWPGKNWEKKAKN